MTLQKILLVKVIGHGIGVDLIPTAVFRVHGGHVAANGAIELVNRAPKHAVVKRWFSKHVPRGESYLKM